jgi:hypothetical protein
MKGKLGFIVFVVVVVGVLLLYTFTAKEYPRLPGDAMHRGVSAPAACMECHGPGKKYAMKKTHPPKFDCPKCHEPAK